MKPLISLSMFLSVTCAALFSSSIVLAQPSLHLEQPTQVVLLDLGLQLNYPQPVRLDQVLFDAQLQNQQAGRQAQLSYHEGYRLFNLAKQEQVDDLYQHVQSQLLSLKDQKKYADASQTLLTLLEAHQYAYRENVVLDLDAVRLKAELNPALPGQYALKQIGREEYVQLIGLVQTKDAHFSAGLTLADYLSQTKRLPDGNPSAAWLIHPNGESQKLGYSYWNNQRTTPLPGSMIFVGFDSNNLALQALEQDIVTLLGMIKG